MYGGSYRSNSSTGSVVIVVVVIVVGCYEVGCNSEGGDCYHWWVELPGVSYANSNNVTTDSAKRTRKK